MYAPNDLPITAGQRRPVIGDAGRIQLIEEGMDDLALGEQTALEYLPMAPPPLRLGTHGT